MFSPPHWGRAALVAIAAGLSPARGQDSEGTEPPRAQESSRSKKATRPVLTQEITPQLRQAIQRGFNYLVRNQQSSGTFAGSDGCHVAVDALAGLAFLAGGFTDKDGPYTEALKRGVKSLLRSQNDRGYFDDGESRMYGHGFATLFLAELYGMTGENHDEVRAALKKSVNVIEISQSKDGGWDYQPDERFGGAGYRNESDTSITVCQAMALRAARNLGIQVDSRVVERARAYIRKAQNPDGGFCYRMGGITFGRSSQFARSAAGVCILYALGTQEDYGSSELRRGYEYLLENHRTFSQFPFYGHYYCTQAMYQAGGKYWASYFPYLRERLLRDQKSDGSWVSGGMEITAQATAMALISLQVPFRLLPITEK